ncbi:hypothetical protein RIF29_17624 [Crotalaria pallida]|uniref:Uncharacterized protein n=1 Tax=Crotalaria pallida TaxID=3830 RepID=A0AAN9FIQ2_CROPI
MGIIVIIISSKGTILEFITNINIFFTTLRALMANCIEFVVNIGLSGFHAAEEADNNKYSNAKHNHASGI